MRERANRARVPSARARVLRAVADHPSQPVTLRELVEVLGGHPSATRQHLEALQRDGHVATTPLSRPTTGRRPLGYELTPQGHRALTATESDAYRDLVRATASHRAATPDQRADALGVGAAWGAQIAAETPLDAHEPWDGVVQALDLHGFAPEPRGAGEVVLTACPLLQVAVDHRDFVCTVHEGMAQELLARLGDARPVELRPFAEPRGCTLRLVGRSA